MSFSSIWSMTGVKDYIERRALRPFSICELFFFFQIFELGRRIALYKTGTSQAQISKVVGSLLRATRVCKWGSLRDFKVLLRLVKGASFLLPKAVKLSFIPPPLQFPLNALLLQLNSMLSAHPLPPLLQPAPVRRRRFSVTVFPRG